MMQQHEPLIKHISISFWSFLTVQKANLIYAIQRTRSTRENEEKVMSCMTFKKISFQKITKSPSYSQIDHTRVPETNSEGPKTYIQIPNGISTSLFLFFHSQTAYVLSPGFKGYCTAYTRICIKIHLFTQWPARPRNQGVVYLKHRAT